MITAIELTNFKTHEHNALCFGAGTNVIVGVMGSGKSSVMEALCLGLFGTFPALKSHKLSLSDLIRGFSKDDKPGAASVRVDFQADGESYSVTRQVGEGTSEAYLRKEGILLEGPQPQRVTERVCELLEMDYDTFVRTAYSEQNRIDHFLNVGKGDRKRQLDDLLGLERLETARQSLSTACNKLATESNSLLFAAPSAEQVTEAERLLVAAEESAGFFESRMLELSEAEDSCRKALELKNREVETARFARDRIKLAQAGVQTADAALSAINAETTQRRERMMQIGRELGGKNSEQVESELLESNVKIRALETSLVEAASRQSSARHAVERHARATAELENTQASLSKLLLHAGVANQAELIAALASCEQQRTAFQQKAAQYRALFDASTKAFDALQGAEAECPVCERPLGTSEREALSEKKEDEVRHYEAEAAAADALFSSENAKEHELRFALEKASASSEKMALLFSESAQLSAEAKKAPEADGLVEKAKAELAAEQQKSAGLSRTSQLAVSLLSEERGLNFALEKAKRANDEKNAQLRILESLKAEGIYLGEESHARLEAGREEAMRRVFETSSEKEKAFSQSQIKRNEAASIFKNLADTKAVVERANTLSKKASKAKAMQNALVEVQENLRSRLISAVNSELSSAWALLYPYHDYSSVRLSALSDDYALELCTSNGEWIGAERASGGERSIASLALRMAFARVLAPKLDVLILDEPTHNLDAAGISTLSTALRLAASGPAGFSQVFVITHEEGLRDAAEGAALYEFSRSKEDSSDPTSINKQ